MKAIRKKVPKIVEQPYSRSFYMYDTDCGTLFCQLITDI